MNIDWLFHWSDFGNNNSNSKRQWRWRRWRKLEKKWSGENNKVLCKIGHLIVRDRFDGLSLLAWIFPVCNVCYNKHSLSCAQTHAVPLFPDSFTIYFCFALNPYIGGSLHCTSGIDHCHKKVVVKRHFLNSDGTVHSLSHPWSLRRGAVEKIKRPKEVLVSDWIDWIQLLFNACLNYLPISLWKWQAKEMYQQRQRGRKRANCPKMIRSQTLSLNIIIKSPCSVTAPELWKKTKCHRARAHVMAVPFAKKCHTVFFAQRSLCFCFGKKY